MDVPGFRVEITSPCFGDACYPQSRAHARPTRSPPRSVTSDELDMACMEDGTMVDGMFWRKLDIVHQGDPMECSGTRLANDNYSLEFMFDSPVMTKLAVTGKPTTAKCHLSVLRPLVQYCDIMLMFAPLWKLGITWPPAEARRARYRTILTLLRSARQFARFAPDTFEHQSDVLFEFLLRDNLRAKIFAIKVFRNQSLAHAGTDNMLTTLLDNGGSLCRKMSRRPEKEPCRRTMAIAILYFTMRESTKLKRAEPIVAEYWCCHYLSNTPPICPVLAEYSAPRFCLKLRCPWSRTTGKRAFEHLAHYLVAKMQDAHAEFESLRSQMKRHCAPDQRYGWAKQCEIGAGVLDSTSPEGAAHKNVVPISSASAAWLELHLICPTGSAIYWHYVALRVLTYDPPHIRQVNFGGFFPRRVEAPWLGVDLGIKVYYSCAACGVERAWLKNVRWTVFGNGEPLPSSFVVNFALLARLLSRKLELNDGNDAREQLRVSHAEQGRICVLPRCATLYFIYLFPIALVTSSALPPFNSLTRIPAIKTSTATNARTRTEQEAEEVALFRALTYTANTNARPVVAPTPTSSSASTSTVVPSSSKNTVVSLSKTSASSSNAAASSTGSSSSLKSKDRNGDDELAARTPTVVQRRGESGGHVRENTNGYASTPSRSPSSSGKNTVNNNVHTSAVMHAGTAARGAFSCTGSGVLQSHLQHSPTTAHPHSHASASHPFASTSASTSSSYAPSPARSPSPSASSVISITNNTSNVSMHGRPSNASSVHITSPRSIAANTDTDGDGDPEDGDGRGMWRSWWRLRGALALNMGVTRGRRDDDARRGWDAWSGRDGHGHERDGVDAAPMGMDVSGFAGDSEACADTDARRTMAHSPYPHVAL
ncbi:hypothetical protein B0H16DRAFT_1794590 [Mycena metata]|uniref:Uncharacterized protein n=1 Tax=Mycena metata TaxID=1033252 RepID=A0AAD7JL66_9AGAR|nr:hypothetical protein B0H16DRAFT_1794590 [Mycena metata]